MRADQSRELTRLAPQHVRVYEDQGIHRLHLRARRHLALHRQIREELRDLGGPHLPWMTLSME
jgi:hypothetical protein